MMLFLFITEEIYFSVYLIFPKAANMQLIAFSINLES